MRVHLKLIGLAARHRLPAVYFGRVGVDAGGLISYGPSPDISHLISASGRRISESCFARTTSCRFEERPDADRV